MHQWYNISKVCLNVKERKVMKDDQFEESLEAIILLKNKQNRKIYQLNKRCVVLN